MQARNFEKPIPQAELELIIETIPDAVIVIDHSGRITFANQAAETIIGLSCSEITARTYNAPEWKLTTVDGEPFPEGELPLDLVMRDGKPVYGVELAIERPDGKRVILSVSAAPVRDAKGNIASVVASFTDVTECKMAELALQESETRFTAIFEQATYGIYMGGLDGILVSANRALEDIFGYTRDEINRMGGFFEVAYPDPEERERIRDMAKRSMQAQVLMLKFPWSEKTGEEFGFRCPREQLLFEVKTISLVL